MQKILLFILFSAFTFASSAQSLFSEGFDNLGSPITLPSGWTSSNLSSPIGTASWFRGNTSSFTAYEGPTDGYIGVNFQSGAGVATLNNWLFAPSVTVRNGDEISFYTRVPTTSTWPDRLELRMSTLGEGSTAPTGTTDVGSYTTACLTVNPSLTSTGYPKVWTKYTYTVSGLSGDVSCKFALRYYVTNGGPDGANSNYIGVDSFKIQRPIQNDLTLNSVVVPTIISAGNFTFNGVVFNSGSNNVTSYQITWQSNGGVVNSMDVNSVNIASGSTHNFSHSIPLNAVAGGLYNLIFNISSVNGGADSDATNNTKTGLTTVPSGSTTMKPIIEKFTANWCTPCANYNATTFNSFYAANSSNFTYIAYHASPSDGNTNADSQARGNYYAFGGYPTVYMNAVDLAPGFIPTTAQTTAGFATAQALPAYFVLNGTHTLDGNNISGTVNYSTYLSGNYRLRIAVVENTTTLFPGSNGETSFKHVLRKMIPNPTGTEITFTAGQDGSFNYNAELTGLAVNQLSNLSVVVFVQNDTTKEIYQSAYSVYQTVGIDDFNAQRFNVYPNPANDFINISNIENAEISIYDITGKVIKNSSSVNSTTQINVSDLNPGVYFINIKNLNAIQTVKFFKD